jgi:putative DNA primase/helicase
MTSAAAIAKALGGRKCADGYLCRCPVPSHGQGRGDQRPSLLVSDGNKAALFKCFAGCDVRDILSTLRSRGIVGESNADDHGCRDDDVVEQAPEHLPNPEALELWHAAAPIIASSTQAQFLASRGITMGPPPSLRAISILHLRGRQSVSPVFQGFIGLPHPKPCPHSGLAEMPGMNF